jgi:diguanylate cyclase (GGDEF)-like protein
MSHIPDSSSLAWLKNRWLPPAVLSVPALLVLFGAQWESGAPVLAWEVAGFATSGLLLAGGLVCVLMRRAWVREAAHRREEQACGYMREVIEQLPAAIELYDPQDRLIVCNRQMEKMYPQHNRARVLGQTYETLLREAVRQGLLSEVPIGQEEGWIRQRLAKRCTSSEPLLRRLPDGGWIHVHEARTPSGYLVVTRLDVTTLLENSLALERANSQLSRLSTTDGLTGVANRRMFDRTLVQEWQRSMRSQQPVSLLMIDIDYFKRYNDHYGHLAGDACLRQVAEVLQACAQRSGELVARYGGEEFALLLPGADEPSARVVAQRCMDQLRQAQIPHAASPVSSWLTLSIGIATLVALPDQPSDLLVKTADDVLYRMKKSGRARFETNEPTTAAG